MRHHRGHLCVANGGAWSDATIAALALMVPRALEAADRLAANGIEAEVIDVRSHVPLDTRTLLQPVHIGIRN